MMQSSGDPVKDGMQFLYQGPMVGGGAVVGVGPTPVAVGVVMLFDLEYDFGEGVIVPFDCEKLLVGYVRF